MERFLRKIHRLYGGWPRRLVTDWGFWYRRVSVVRTESMCGCSLLSLKRGWRALRDTSQGGVDLNLGQIPLLKLTASARVYVVLYEVPPLGQRRANGRNSITSLPSLP